MPRQDPPRTGVVLLTGVSPEAMTAAMVAMQFDLPQAVAVRHEIDVDAQILRRVVSDVTGVLEEHETHLAHACVSCALREDIVPTLERLARDGRWAMIVAHLPVGAEAAQVCHVVGQDPKLLRRMRISSVVVALTGESLVDDLLGDSLLVELGLHTAYDDHRGVGEVACAMIEAADVITADGGMDARGRDLVGVLARPDALVADECVELDGSLLAGSLHDHDHTARWTAVARAWPLPPATSDTVWRRDLRDDRAFHPGRLLAGLSALGGGRHRSRGCFWLPTRPGRVLEWDGSGGQLSIGDHGSWERRTSFTRIVLAGVGAAPGHLEGAFADLLLRPEEEALSWVVAEDGFEPWLGPVRRAA